jgi:hypothetical protein
VQKHATEFAAGDTLPHLGKRGLLRGVQVEVE